MVFYGSEDVDLGKSNSGYTGSGGGGGGGGVPTTDLTLCIGLVVAFIIFLAVVLVIVKLLKKKGSGNQNHSGYTLTPPGIKTLKSFHQFLYNLIFIAGT